MTAIIEADDVTDEVLRMAEETFESWFDDDQPIDWDDTPAMRKIQRHVRKYRSQE